jgi:hypothetical protein
MNGSLSLLHEREEIMARVIRVKYFAMERACHQRSL